MKNIPLFGANRSTRVSKFQIFLRGILKSAPGKRSPHPGFPAEPKVSRDRRREMGISAAISC